MNAGGSILSDWIIQIVLWLCDLGENPSVLEGEIKGILSDGNQNFHTFVASIKHKMFIKVGS